MCFGAHQNPAPTGSNPLPAPAPVGPDIKAPNDQPATAPKAPTNTNVTRVPSQSANTGLSIPASG